MSQKIINHTSSSFSPPKVPRAPQTLYKEKKKEMEKLKKEKEKKLSFTCSHLIGLHGNRQCRLRMKHTFSDSGKDAPPTYIHQLMASSSPLPGIMSESIQVHYCLYLHVHILLFHSPTTVQQYIFMGHILCNFFICC